VALQTEEKVAIVAISNAVNLRMVLIYLMFINIHSRNEVGTRHLPLKANNRPTIEQSD